MSVEGFLTWRQPEDILDEFVEGVPVPHVKMMTGASAQHGTGCRPTTDDIGLRTGIETLRRPDVTRECGDVILDRYESHKRRLVVEALSPTTSTIDHFRKLEEYKRHPTIACILLVETRWPSAALYRRDDDVCETQAFEAMDAVIGLPVMARACRYPTSTTT